MSATVALGARPRLWVPGDWNALCIGLRIGIGRSPSSR